MDYPTDQRISAIRDLLKGSSRGMSISEIADQLGTRRNLISRDLKYLHRLGQVEMQSIGTSKVYFYTAKIPISGILNYSSDLIMVLDENREIIEVNEPLLRMVRLEREDLVRKNIADCDHPLLAPLRAFTYDTEWVERFAIWLPVLEDPRAIRHFKVKHIPTVFEDTSRGSFLFIEDISEQVRYRDALRISEAHYKAIVEVQKELIFRFLPDGTLIFTNKIFQDVLGADQDFRGKKFTSLLPETEAVRFSTELDGLTPEFPSKTLVSRIGTKEGPRDYSFTVYAIFDPNGQLFAYQGIGRDITPELNAQKEMERHMQDLEFLCRKSDIFLETSTSRDIFRTISAGIVELVPDAVIMTFSYDEDGRSMILQTMQDEKGGDLKEILFSGEDYRFSLPPSFLQGDDDLAMIRKGEIRPLDTDQFLPVIGEDVVRKLRDAIGERSVFATMMVWEGALVGAVAIATLPGTGISERILVETFIHMGALALQRHITRESLFKSDNRFRLIAETAPLPISIISENGAYLFLNEKFTETFGYTREDLPDGKRWFLQAFPDALEMQKARSLWEEDLKRSKPGEIRPRQFTVRCKDGSFKSIIFRPVTLMDGCQLVIYEDVTEMEEAGKVKNLLAEIVRSSHDGIIGMTPGGRIQTWNPGAERIYGYTAEEAVGKDISLIFPESLAHEKDTLLSRTNRGEFITGFETQRMRKDGRLIDVSVTISPIFTIENRIIGTSTIVRDISARKSQERIRQLESHYQQMVDSINVGVYRSTGDPEGRFLWGNTSLVRILGYSSLESVRDLPVAELFIRAHGREELLEDLKKKGFVRNRELLLKRADGSVAYVLVTALATFDEKGDISYINGIVEDITEQRILARKLASLENAGNGDPGNT
jgi:PAS domain S-box-containing protein